MADPILHRLSVHNQPTLLQELGGLAIAHTHLEQILRDTVDTLSSTSGSTNLGSTTRKGVSYLRKKTKRLFKKLNPTVAEKSQLDALLEKAKILSEKRHAYMHRIWSLTPEGKSVLHQEGLHVEAAPSEAAIERLTSDLLALGKKITYARLHGFMHEVTQRQPPSVSPSSEPLEGSRSHPAAPAAKVITGMSTGVPKFS